MSEPIVALRFSVVIDNPVKAEHSRYRCEGIINCDLEEHMKSCKECRDTIVKDLRDFADQLEQKQYELPEGGNRRGK